VRAWRESDGRGARGEISNTTTNGVSKKDDCDLILALADDELTIQSNGSSPNTSVEGAPPTSSSSSNVNDVTLNAADVLDSLIVVVVDGKTELCLDYERADARLARRRQRQRSVGVAGHDDVEGAGMIDNSVDSVGVGTVDFNAFGDGGDADFSVHTSDYSRDSDFDDVVENANETNIDTANTDDVVENTSSINTANTANITTDDVNIVANADAAAAAAGDATDVAAIVTATASASAATSTSVEYSVHDSDYSHDSDFNDVVTTTTVPVATATEMTTTTATATASVTTTDFSVHDSDYSHDSDFNDVVTSVANIDADVDDAIGGAFVAAVTTVDDYSQHASDYSHDSDFNDVVTIVDVDVDSARNNVTVSGVNATNCNSAAVSTSAGRSASASLSQSGSVNGVTVDDYSLHASDYSHDSDYEDIVTVIDVYDSVVANIASFIGDGGGDGGSVGGVDVASSAAAVFSQMMSTVSSSSSSSSLSSSLSSWSSSLSSSRASSASAPSS
jgi:hypothetical protein